MVEVKKHICTSKKYDIQNRKMAIKDSGFSADEVNLIWDFYVTKSPAEQSAQSISFTNYGWANTTNKENGYPALENALAKDAGIESFYMIRATSIKNTLNSVDLGNRTICIEHPRAVLIQKYSVKVEENETMKLNPEESRVACLFRHIRNSFAHGNTYFFENDMMLLEDKDKSTITARILMPRKSLLSWIDIVDKDKISNKEV